MLRLSKHSEPFFGNLLEIYNALKKPTQPNAFGP
jgi:hypothetical protein